MARNRLNKPLKAFTDHTVTGPNWLRRELIRTTLRGYAIEDREYHPDTRALAAPVFSHNREAIAALAVVAPTTRLPPEHFKPRGQTVTRAAAGLSAELGYIPLRTQCTHNREGRSPELAQEGGHGGRRYGPARA